jgi:triacylglycerol esterase/lipase EstA (alpha/beta hydrolase family)
MEARIWTTPGLTGMEWRGIPAQSASFLGGVAAPLALPTFNAFGQVSADLPIVFVHGNGDQAPIWLPTLRRCESNGYRRDRLHAVNFADPTALC